MTRASLALLTSLAIGCRPPGSDRVTTRELPGADGKSLPPVPQEPTGKPSLVSVTPSESRLVSGGDVQLVLSGERFDRSSNGGNTIDIGPVHLEQVPSEGSGTRIRVALPDRYAGSGEAPPRRLMPGDYTVTVTTAAGTSNPLSFRILP